MRAFFSSRSMKGVWKQILAKRFGMTPCVPIPHLEAWTSIRATVGLLDQEAHRYWMSVAAGGPHITRLRHGIFSSSVVGHAWCALRPKFRQFLQYMWPLIGSDDQRRDAQARARFSRKLLMCYSKLGRRRRQRFRCVPRKRSYQEWLCGGNCQVNSLRRYHERKPQASYPQPVQVRDQSQRDQDQNDEKTY